MLPIARPATAPAHLFTALVALFALVAMAVPAFGAAAGDDQVRLKVGDDLQAVIDAHPAGTHYVIASGVHRLQRIVPDDGDVFTGEPDAVLSGAKVLDQGWTQDSQGRWYVDGQTQQGETSGHYGCGHYRDHQYADCGHEQEVHHAEEVFVDGTRWRHVNDLTDLDGEGTWHFDYDTDRIYLGSDPADRLVETSVTDYAFVGENTRDVTIENLTVRHYANRAQRGAINALNSRDWTIRHIDASYNHGAGIGVGAGTQLSNCRANHNGQLGIHGRGDPDHDRPIHISSCEIGHNRQLGFQEGWESGGTKFVRTRNMIFENNWVHNNRESKGLWFDIDNLDAIIRSNLIENNGVAGIFYEVNFGAEIYDNIVRHNNRDPHVRTLQAGIWIVDSSDVEIHSNLVYDNGKEILGHHQNRRDRGSLGWTSLRNLHVHNNDVRIDPAGPGSEGGEVGVRHSSSMFEDPYDPEFGIRFHTNTYRLDDPDTDRVFRWTNDWNWYDPDGWQHFDHDTDATYLDHTTTGSLPDHATPYQPTTYGPTHTNDTPDNDSSSTDPDNEDTTEDDGADDRDSSGSDEDTTENDSDSDSTDPNNEDTLAGSGLRTPADDARGATGTFRDVPDGHTHAEAIRRMAEAGVLGGYEDGSFRPDQSITRAQIATMLVRLLALDTDAAADGFEDVAASHPHAEAIAATASQELMTGLESRRFGPDLDLSRAQGATVLTRAFELPSATGSAPFHDVADGPHVAGITAVAEHGLLSGYVDGRFHPNRSLTRGQFATILDRAYS